MDYRKQVGYLKGLCSGLQLAEDKPERKLLLAIVDTLDAMSDALMDTREDIEELEDDLQTMSDEVGEMEALSDEMEQLDDYLEELGEAMNDLFSLFQRPGDVSPITPIRLLHPDEDDEDEDSDDEDLDDEDLDDEDEGIDDVEIYAVCPDCGARVPMDEKNIIIKKKDEK